MHQSLVHTFHNSLLPRKHTQPHLPCLGSRPKRTHTSWHGKLKRLPRQSLKNSRSKPSNRLLPKFAQFKQRKKKIGSFGMPQIREKHSYLLKGSNCKDK